MFSLFCINVFDTEDVYLKINGETVQLTYNECVSTKQLQNIKLFKANKIYYNFIINGVETYNKNGIYEVKEDGTTMNYFVINHRGVTPISFIDKAIEINDLFILYSIALHVHNIKNTGLVMKFENYNKYFDIMIIYLEQMAEKGILKAVFKLADYYYENKKYDKSNHYYDIICNTRTKYTEYSQVIDMEDLNVIKEELNKENRNKYLNIDNLRNLYLMHREDADYFAYELAKHYTLEQNHFKIMQFHKAAISINDCEESISDLTEYFKDRDIKELIDFYISIGHTSIAIGPIVELFNYYSVNNYNFDEFCKIILNVEFDRIDMSDYPVILEKLTAKGIEIIAY